MKKILEIFIKKGVEKAILAISVLAFLTYLMLGIVFAGKNKELDELNQKAQDIKANIESATKANIEIPSSTYAYTIDGWYKIPNFTEGSHWIAYKPTKVIRKDKPPEDEIKPTVQKPRKLARQKIKNITAQVGSIYIEWEMEREKTHDFVIAVPSSYKVERKVEGEKEYNVIATENTTKYNDINIQPKTTYYYRIVSLSEGMKPEISEEKSVKSAGVFTLTFKGTMGDTAYIIVNKFEAAKQKQFSKDFRVKKGNEIGEKGIKILDQATKTNVAIDFNTGYKAKSWGDEKVTVSDLICKNASDENHQPEMESRPVKETSFTYIDDEGKEKKIWKNDKEPQGVDKRCSKHKEDKKTEEAPPQKELQETEKKVK